MELIRADLAALGVKMDVFFSEKSLYGTGRIEAALADLDGKGLIYEGVLEPPKGKMPEDWEPREQTLFRSTRMATMLTGQSRNPTDRGPISHLTSPITTTRSDGAMMR